MVNYFFISLCSSDEGNSDVVTCALADASGTSYVRGRWISDSENSFETQHRIVAPTLPGSGDYSAYSLWGKVYWLFLNKEFKLFEFGCCDYYCNLKIIIVDLKREKKLYDLMKKCFFFIFKVAANRDGVPGANKENSMHNPAYNISAALTYTTQLVNVLAYYVNIRLPYKLTYG